MYMSTCIPTCIYTLMFDIDGQIEIFVHEDKLQDSDDIGSFQGDAREPVPEFQKIRPEANKVYASRLRGLVEHLCAS